MNRLQELIKRFEIVDDWEGVVKENFERKSGTYSYVTITNIEVKYKDRIFHFPTKIVFESGYIKCQRNIKKNEIVTIDNKKVEITERKKIIPFSLYERKEKYSGEIFQIIKDIFEDKKFIEAKFCNDLLTPNNDPLYSIDSTLKWSSYLLIFREKSNNITTDLENDYSYFNDILKEYGIHYEYDSSIRKYSFVIFPMPYLKMVENKINRDDKNESIFIVLEFNQIGFFYNSQLNIEIDALIKSVKDEVIYQNTIKVKYAKSKYQIVQILPDKIAEIGFSSISVRINGVLVDNFSGYYIRDIKFNIKLM